MSYVLFIITIPLDESSKANVTKVTEENATNDEAANVKPPTPPLPPANVDEENAANGDATIAKPPTSPPVIEDATVDESQVDQEEVSTAPTSEVDGSEGDEKQVVEAAIPSSPKTSIQSQEANDGEDDNQDTPVVQTIDDVKVIEEDEIEEEKNRKKLRKGVSYYDLRKICRLLLTQHKVMRPAWLKTESNTHWKILCHVRGERVDDLLNSLLVAGIGNNDYSSISIIPVNIHFPTMVEDSDSDGDNVGGETVEGEESVKLKKDRNDFFQTVKSRMNVAQVISSVKSGSVLTFDYVMLLILAGMIAAVGLMENSSVLLVASMLVSPLMGPILGGTFGLVLQHKRVWKPAIINELIGLSICVGVGVIFGLLTFFGGLSNWDVVTSEMKSRGQARGLVVGVLIAIPSGAAVALSILGGNMGSLVGVAISASLLPPAVNAGMFWAFAVVCSIVGDPTPGSDKILHHEPAELASLGAISVTLTLVNIFIIFLMGVLILKIKEVAPHTASAVTSTFWKKDLRETRQSLKTDVSEEDKLFEEWGRIHNVDLTNKQTIQGPDGQKLLSEYKEFCEYIVDNDSDYSAVTNRLQIKTANSFANVGLLDQTNPRFTVKSVHQPKEKTTVISRFQQTKLVDTVDSSTTDSTQKIDPATRTTLAGVSSTHTLKTNQKPKSKSVTIKIDNEEPSAVEMTSMESDEKNPLL